MNVTSWDLLTTFHSTSELHMIDLRTLNPHVAMNRMTFLAMMDEFDIKGKLSGKAYSSIDNQPHDFFGYYVQRLGYQLGVTKDKCHLDGAEYGVYGIARWTLNIYMTRPIWEEIDRQDSTNQSIRELTKNLFAREPIDIRAREPYKEPNARAIAYGSSK